MTLPTDNDVHSEWSWDAHFGSMERSCERARENGLPSIAFIERVDYTVWTASVAGLATVPADHPVAILADAAGHVTPLPSRTELVSYWSMRHLAATTDEG
jgi:hypothetical protein